jgi:hypothetical protein
MRVGVALAALTVGFAVVELASAPHQLVATAAAASSGDWDIKQKTDPITGAPASTALLRSSRTVHSTLGFTPASFLELGCFKGLPSVGLVFQFDVGSTKESEFGYRFDAKPGHQIDARVLPNHSTIVIEAKGDVGKFASELAASNTLYVQIRSLTEGQTTAEFAVAGAQAAIDAAFAGCPLSAH